MPSNRYYYYQTVQRRDHPLTTIVEEGSASTSSPAQEPQAAYVALGSMIGLGVFALNITTLVVSHTDAVRDSCGMTLWWLMVSNIIVHSSEFCVFGCLAACVAGMLGKTGMSIMLGLEGLLLLGQECTFIALMVTEIRGQSAECTTALSDNFAHAPLLTIFAWLVVSGLSLVVLMSVLATVMGSCLSLRQLRALDAQMSV